MFKKEYWKKAGSSLFASTITLPVLTFILSYLVSLVQVAVFLEELEYNAYRVCREAVVCSTYEEAYAEIEEIINEEYDEIPCNYILQTINIDTGEPFEYATWKKGEFVELKIKAFCHTASPFSSDFKETSVIMMIENPA